MTFNRIFYSFDLSRKAIGLPELPNHPSKAIDAALSARAHIGVCLRG